MDVYYAFTTSQDNHPHEAMNSEFHDGLEGFLSYEPSGDQYCADTATDPFTILFDNPFAFKGAFGEDGYCAAPASSLIYTPPSPPNGNATQPFSTTISDAPSFSSPSFDASPTGSFTELSPNSFIREALSPFSISDTSSSGSNAVNSHTVNFALDDMDSPSSPATTRPAAVEKRGKPRKTNTSLKTVPKATQSNDSAGAGGPVPVKKRRGRPRVENTELRQARHRERNRLAASRCRVKQRRRTNELELRAEEMEAQNAQLLKLKDELGKQVLRLRVDVLAHKRGCCCRTSPGTARSDVE